MTLQMMIIKMGMIFQTECIRKWYSRNLWTIKISRGNEIFRLSVLVGGRILQAIDRHWSKVHAKTAVYFIRATNTQNHHRLQ